ncbi:MAG: ROK family protein, partial [Defluviitaleaceae bacterium]|nr:ROK family protein [Defluviitaleaceae bacterium]
MSGGIHVLALDIGGSKIAAGIVGRNGEINNYVKWQLPAKYDSGFIVDSIIENTNLMRGNSSIAAAGASIPAVTDAKNGIWVYAPFSGVSDFPIAAILSQKFGFPVYIENDVNACAMGEMVFGMCKDTTDFLWVTISNGIGGGLVLNGKVYGGQGGCAGEIGHVTVEENGGLICGCKKPGCLEAEAAGFAIAKKFNAKH